MKVYNLRCEHDHRFEGWFASEEDFTKQVQGGHIACPMCESCSVVKLPSAPRLNLSTAHSPQAPEVSQQVQAQVMKLLRTVVANTEDVGERFADEARRMHYNEAPERAIRGLATPKEREALVDEGIDVVALPLPAALKKNLQ